MRHKGTPKTRESDAEGTSAAEQSTDETFNTPERKTPRKRKRELESDKMNGVQSGANDLEVNPGASFSIVLSQAIQRGDIERVSAIISRIDVKSDVVQVIIM